jgi:N6-adenosine-specific RNA methylase IME4
VRLARVPRVELQALPRLGCAHAQNRRGASPTQAQSRHDGQDVAHVAHVVASAAESNCVLERDAGDRVASASSTDSIGESPLKFHPLSELFPLMQGREFDELVADVKANGLREPIWTYQGQILDGRNRWRACEAGQISHRPMREYEGDDPVAFVVSLNLHRRHLDESQRAMVAGKLATLSDGQRADLVEGLPIGRAAELLNVGERTVARAREVQQRGAPELVDAVESGMVSVSAAADVAELPKEKQREIVARGEKEILEAAKQIRAAKQEERRAERIEKVAAMAQPEPTLPASRYPVIYADPPWRYEFAESESRAIENQYPTMDLDAICALDIASLATDDAILFMWATSPKLAEAMRVLDSWGFTYRSSAVWVKPQLGMGYYFRQQHELLLVATRGSIPAPAPGDRPRSVYESPREAHSAKPLAFYEFIEAMYPTLPRIELFARAPRDGWAGWGNQLAA